MGDYTDADAIALDRAYSEIAHQLQRFPHDDECAYRCLNQNCHVGHGCGVCDAERGSCESCGAIIDSKIVEPGDLFHEPDADCRSVREFTGEFNVEGQPEFNGAFR